MIAIDDPSTAVYEPTDISCSDSLTSIVIRYPETKAVFQAFGLIDTDLGWLSIGALAAEKGLDIETLEAALHAAVAKGDTQCANRVSIAV